tara:strand:+ start:4050 stop:4979 length:930 start_codon:yes stop_codon:yes gene_type:complete
MTLKIVDDNSFSVEALGIRTATCTVRVPGVCGELVQGLSDNHPFLVTCPIDFFSKVTVEIYERDGFIICSEGFAKSAEAVRKTAAYLKKTDISARTIIQNPMPRGKGFGSSSADITGCIASTSIALGQTLTPTEISNIALEIEPTDAVMYPGIALFDYKQGKLSEELGSAPPMEIIALDFGGFVDTVLFNQVDRQSAWESIKSDTEKALELVRSGLNNGDPTLIAEGSTISALASQKISEKQYMNDVLQFSKAVGGLGICVGHSGTVIGVLLDGKAKVGKYVFRQARSCFPLAEEIYHFRIIDGGIRLI